MPVDVDEAIKEYLSGLRSDTEGQKPPRGHRGGGNWFTRWWGSLFIVRLWRGATNRILVFVESSDPLALTGGDTASASDKQRESLHRIMKTNQRLRLRRLVANWAIFFVTLQLACSNWFFWTYLAENRFSVPEGVMISWMSACVVEVIGILVVIARSLFPKRDRLSSEKDSK